MMRRAHARGGGSRQEDWAAQGQSLGWNAAVTPVSRGIVRLPATISWLPTKGACHGQSRARAHTVRQPPPATAAQGGDLAEHRIQTSEQRRGDRAKNPHPP